MWKRSPAPRQGRSLQGSRLRDPGKSKKVYDQSATRLAVVITPAEPAQLVPKRGTLTVYKEAISYLIRYLSHPNKGDLQRL